MTHNPPLYERQKKCTLEQTPREIARTCRPIQPEERLKIHRKTGSSFEELARYSLYVFHSVAEIYRSQARPASPECSIVRDNAK